MTSCRRFVLTKFLLFLILTPACPVQAEKFELNTGETVEGTVLDQNADYYYLDTAQGVISLEKSKIAGRGGQPVPAAIRVTLDAKGSTWQVREPAPIHPLAAVGNGGVTQERLQPYLEAAASGLGKPVSSLTADEKRQALESAVNDELIYQERLSQGFHRLWPLRDKLFKLYLEKESQKPEVLQSLSQTDYDQAAAQHPEVTRNPIEVQAFYFISNGETADAMEKIREEARTAPDQFTRWIPFGATGVIAPGWIREDTAIIGASDEMRAAIKHLFTMNPGAFSEILPCGRGRTLFSWVKQKKGGEPLPADQVRQALAQKILRARIVQGAPSKDEEEDRLFRAALEAGTYRDPDFRQSLFHDFASESRRGEALQKLRVKYAVTLLKDPA